jgi:RNA polymerase sigma factor (TIGR02999 family)
VATRLAPSRDARIPVETRHGHGQQTIDLESGNAPPFGVASTSQVDVTALLRAWAGGDDAAGDCLIPLVYRELRRRAGAYLRRERPGHTLQPTALVHEAYLRLVGQRKLAWKNRAQFLALAAQMMRRILVDHARRGKVGKRSGRWMRVELDAAVPAPDADSNVVALNDLLNRLAEFDLRKSRVVELRYFGGLSLNETARVLGVSPATVDREWRLARAWLRRRLNNES